MDEAQQAQAQGKEQFNPALNPNEGMLSSTGIISQAVQEREALQRENERLEKNLAELREFEAKSMLAGTAGMRIEPKEITEQKKRKMDAVNFWKGTAIADAIEKQNE